MKYNQSLRENIVLFLLAVLGTLVFAGMIIQNVEYIGSLSSLKEATPPFELAILSTVLGGFFLPVALKIPKRTSSSRKLARSSIMLTARLFLAAAFSYTTLYALLYLVKNLSVPSNWVFWLIAVPTDTFLIIGPLTFAAGLTCLALVILYWVEDT
jgi:hypothetical protein